MANPVTLAQAASFLTNDTLKWSAWGLRDNTSRPPGEGVNHQEAWRVMPRQAGVNMSVDVGKTGVGLMEAWVRGDTRGGQGLYRVDNVDRTVATSSAYTAQINVSVTANAAANPRLDIVVLEVVDMEHIGGGTATAQVRVIAGTATAGATLDNRSGAPSLPVSALLLADILVPALESTSIDPADVRDRRMWVAGSFPAVVAAIDKVGFTPASGLLQYSSTTAVVHASHDLMQAASLMWLPRRIEGATKILWKYVQGATAVTGSYILAIFDASMTLVAGMSASASFTGAANSLQVRSETITATTFEAGAYYVMIGVDTTAGGCGFYGVDGGASAIPGAGLSYRSATGGVSVPATLLSFTDTGTSSSSLIAPLVPLIALSV